MLSIVKSILKNDFLLNLFYVIFNLFRDKRKLQLRVLLYHDISKENYGPFIRHLNYIQENYYVLNPIEFMKYLEGDMELTRDSVFFTFDDGFKSNYLVFKDVLLNRKIFPCFFIISNFVDINDYEESRLFISKNIFPDTIPQNLPMSWTNMDVSNCKFLLTKGCSIGSHTSNHVKLSSLEKNNDSANVEFVESKLRLSSLFNRDIKDFAFPFGNIHSISQVSYNEALLHYRFFYSGFRGNNAVSRNRSLIFRDSFEPSHSLVFLKCSLIGMFDLYYRFVLIFFGKKLLKQN